jgi:WD40 repeat protein/serine/threonine protein kinase
MNDHSDTIELLFARALEKPSSQGRAAYLDEACAGNSALRSRVEALLRAHEQAENFLQEQPQWPQPMADGVPSAEGAGTRIGWYKLLQSLGAGGMGVVYMAEQERPVRRKVALKIIRPGMDSAQVIARFEAERQALALMDHQNIARVLDAGTTESGRPYFVMELVHGVSITHYCDENELTPRQRLELFVSVCQGIQHAHQRGIIHRDIKPSNVLVTLYDGKPAPKIIDFGVAKAIEQRLTERTMFTQYGTMVGTFEYMAPEQAEMSALGVDTRSDIYSLGVLLYELLTGTTPLERQRLSEASYPDVVRMIKEEEPPRPSQLLSSSASLRMLSRQRGTEPARLPNLIRGELDWIVMKCLEKDRARRYETANALARDIQRYLADEPVEACPPSTAYKLHKFARKHKKVLATAAAFVLLLAVAAILATWHAVRASLAEAEANQQRDVAAAAEKDATRQRDEARNVSAQLQFAQQELRGTLYATHMNLARAAWEANNIGRLRELLELTRPRPGERDLRDFEWHYWNRQCHTELLTVQTENASGYTLAPSPDGTRFATTETTASGEKEASSVMRIRDAATGKELLAIKLAAWGYLPGDKAWSPNSTHLALICGRNVEPPDPEIQIWDTVSGKELVSLKGLGSWIHSAAFSPDGRFLAGSFAASGEPRDQPERVRIWDAATAKEMLVISGTRHLAFSPDGKLVAAPIPVVGAAPRQTEVKVWDIVTGKELRAFKPKAGSMGTIVWSPDGARLAGELVTGDKERRFAIQLWDPATGEELFHFDGLHGVRDGPKFSPTGTRLAAAVVTAAGGPQQLEILDATTGKEVCSLPTFRSFTQELAFSPDGTRLATVGDDSTVKVWNIEPRLGADDSRLLLTLRGHTGLVTRVAFNRDGTRLLSSGIDGTVKVWDATEHPESLVLKSAGRPFSTAFSPEAGRYAALARNDSTRAQELMVWELGGTQSPSLKGHRSIKLSESAVRRLLMSHDGTRLASFSRLDASKQPIGVDVKLWDAATGNEVASVKLQDGAGQSHLVAISPDGRRIAYVVSGNQTANGPIELRVWDIATHKDILSITENNVRFAEVTFSPDGARLAAILVEADGHKLKAWDASTGVPLFSYQLPRQLSTRGLVFSPNAARITARTGFWYGPEEITIWDVGTGQRMVALKGHSGKIVSLAFSPDGRRIASVAARDGAWGLPGEVKLWDAKSGRELLTFQGPPASYNHHVAFSPDGTSLYQIGPKMGSESDIEVKVWGAAPPRGVHD